MGPSTPLLGLRHNRLFATGELGGIWESANLWGDLDRVEIASGTDIDARTGDLT